MSALPRIAIIGPGRVGTALGALAARAGWPVAAVGGGGAGKAQAAAELIGAGARACQSAAEAAAAAGAGGLVLLTVPDGAIAPVCAELAAAHALARGSVVAHCCGALPADVLAPARDECGCLIGSIHPLQTFPTVQAAMEYMAGVFCFCEGDEQAVVVLEKLAGAIGGRAVRIASQAKALYHAAACVASNYLVALMDDSAALAEAAGIDAATWRAAVAPLVRATAANIERMGCQRALTGPIARGDAETVGGHMAAIAAIAAGRPSLLGLYGLLGRRTIALAQRAGKIDRLTAEALDRTVGRFLARE